MSDRSLNALFALIFIAASCLSSGCGTQADMATAPGPDESEQPIGDPGGQPDAGPDRPATMAPYIESGEMEEETAGVPRTGMPEELAADSDNEPPVLPDPFGIRPYAAEPAPDMAVAPIDPPVAAIAPERPVAESPIARPGDPEIRTARINPFRSEARLPMPAPPPPPLDETGSNHLDSSPEPPPLVPRALPVPEARPFEPASRDSAAAALAPPPPPPPMTEPEPLPEARPMMLEPQPALLEAQPRMAEPETAMAEPEPIMLETQPPASEAPATVADVQPAVEPQPVEPKPVEPQSAAAITENPDEGFATVKVYYGTDRALETVTQKFSTSLYAALFAAGATMMLIAVAYRFWRTRFARLLATAGVVATIGLVAATANYGLKEGVFTGQKDTPMLSYGGERGKLDLGICKVSIPKDHQVGELEAPSILRLEFKENPEEHVTLMSVEQLPTEDFYADLKQCVAGSRCRSAFVFVHGYNVKFENAVRRTAQIAYDLKFDGAPICYSWPSQGGVTGYTIDETNVAWTVPHLRDFLTGIARQSGAEQVHLIAHSMGNRALTSALRDLSFQSDDVRPEFHEVVLTAPDIDAEVFRRDIAPAIVRTARRVTLYASSNDRALLSSKKVHGYPRAGDSGANLVVVPGVDTIDVSAIDSSLFGLGHSYYGSNDTVLADLFDLLHEAKPAEQRERLISERLGQLQYWRFRQL